MKRKRKGWVRIESSFVFAFFTQRSLQENKRFVRLHILTIISKSHWFNFSLHVSSFSLPLLPIDDIADMLRVIQQNEEVDLSKVFPSLPADPRSHESALWPLSRWCRRWNSWPQTWKKTLTNQDVWQQGYHGPRIYWKHIRSKRTTPGRNANTFKTVAKNLDQSCRQ